MELVIQQKRSDLFVKAVAEANLQIDELTIRWFSAVWYNGVDSSMSTLTLAEYQNTLNI
jgi:hypothetical protein